MAAGIEIYNYVTNQKGSPAIYSDTLTNRPAAGFIGRLFVSTDTFEIYRDNGTGWDLIGSGGGSVNIYNSDGSLTAARTMTMAGHTLTFEGGANTSRLAMSANNNVPRIFSFRTAGSQRWAFRVDDNETGGNSGANWYLRAYNDAGAFTINPISVERATGEKSMISVETLDAGTDTLTGVYNITGGTYQPGLTMTGGNPHGASHNNFTLANAGNLTFANSIYLGAQSNVLRLQGDASGTVTLSPASPGIRTAATTLNQIQWNTSTGNAITYTHASIMQTLGIYRLAAAGSLTVTNAYGIIVNDLNEYGYAATGGGALVLTNRWGIYQDSTTDVNYLGGTTLIGTTTNAGYKLDVAGTLRNTLGANFATTSGNVGINTTTPTVGKLQVNGISALMSTGVNGTLDTAVIFGNFNFPTAQNHRIRTSTSVISNQNLLNIETSNGTTGSYNNNQLVLSGDNNIGFGTNNLYAATNYTFATISGISGGGIHVKSGTTSVAEVYGFASGLVLSAVGSRFIENYTSGVMRYQITPGGNHLFGTSTDAGQRVQIDSSLRLVPTSTVPTASAGAMYYDSATNKLKLYDGTNWVDLN